MKNNEQMQIHICSEVKILEISMKTIWNIGSGKTSSKIRRIQK